MNAPLTLAALVEHAERWPLLLLAPAVWALLGLLERRHEARRALLLGPRAAALAPPPRRRRRARLAFAVALLLALAATLHPSLGATAPAAVWRGMDVVLALDVSRSMLARDVAPDRLTRAKDEIRALAAAAEGDRLGLVLFAGDARVRVPLTRDRASVAAIAEQAEPTDVTLGGTDLAAALDAAAGMIARGAEGHAAVVLLTDGEDLAGRGRDAAARLAARGIAVHALGLGSTRGSRITLPAAEGSAQTYLKDRDGREVLSRLDESSLRALAEAGGGTLRTSGSGAMALVGVHAAHLRPHARAQAAAEGRALPENRYQLLLAAALALLLLDLALRASGRTAHARVPRAMQTSAQVRVAQATASLALLLLLGGCDATREGRALTEEGRHAEALAAFQQAVEAAGEDASPELRLDLALAALRTGDLALAAEASKRAEAKGGAAFGPWAAFVRGNVAFGRSLGAEQEATRPGGDPALLERALTLTEDALAAWRLAATSRADWPEARRNVERALLRLDGLRERRSTSGDPRRRPVILPGAPAGTQPPDATPPAPPAPPTPAPGAEPTADPDATVVTSDLPPAQVATLVETLRAKERQRQALRRAQRERTIGSVEKDW